MSRPKMAKLVKLIVRKRDRVCRLCGHKGSRSNKLTVHHVKPVRSHPELIDDPDNCTLLCEACHRLYHQWEVQNA